MPPGPYHLKRGFEDRRTIAECGRSIIRPLLVPRHQRTRWKSLILSGQACLDCFASLIGARSKLAVTHAVRKLYLEHMAERPGRNGYNPRERVR